MRVLSGGLGWVGVGVGRIRGNTHCYERQGHLIVFWCRSESRKCERVINDVRDGVMLNQRCIRSELLPSMNGLIPIVLSRYLHSGHRRAHFRRLCRIKDRVLIYLVIYSSSGWAGVTLPIACEDFANRNRHRIETRVVPFIVRPILGCNIFDVTGVVIMSASHVRDMGSTRSTTVRLLQFWKLAPS